MTMDYQKARTNMVDGQIHTDGVIVPEILNAFETTPRELFVAEDYKNLACNDEDIPAGEGRYILEPSTHARMIQALELDQSDVVLEIGGVTGYGGAILSPLVSTIISVESDENLAKKAGKLWDDQDIRNVVSVQNDLTQGHPENAPYDSIIINGAIAKTPDALLAQLGENGRLVCIIRPDGQSMGQATLFQKSEDGIISSYPLFDAASPYLAGFEPPPEFQF